MADTQHFIFGYGSLINRESRLSTNPNATIVYPCLVKGIQRGWWTKGVPFGFSTTFLDAQIRLSDSCQCNGVIYPVTEAEMGQTDAREVSYERVQIPLENVTMLDGSESPPEGIIWAYSIQGDVTHKPSSQFPIVQSYVDICLVGCLEIEEAYPAAKEIGFSKLFIQNTVDWSGYWVNDRIQPRRPWVHMPRALQIDQLLVETIPELFNQIQLDPAKWDD